MNNPYGNHYLYPVQSGRRTCCPGGPALPPPSQPRQPAGPSEKPTPTNADWAAQYPGEIFLKGPAPSKLAALTFDDGPDGLFTPLLLDVLTQSAAKATFFCRGSCVRQYSGIIKRMAKEGHVLANHAYSHQKLGELSPDQITREIKATQDALREITGLKTALLRPPYGFMDETVIQISGSLGYKIILWNIDTLDWTGITGPEITARVAPNIVPGAIILMHNQCEANIPAATGSLQSLAYLIAILRAQGYRIVTIPELLNIPAYQ